MRFVGQFLLITTLLTIAGLIGTIAFGFTATPVHVANHLMVALGTVVIGLFSQSMTMFFFIGTGKELKDKVKGAADEASVVKSTRVMKSKVFPAATWAMLMLMVTFIMGGGVASGKTPRLLHDAMAFATLVLYGRAYWVQLQAMIANADLMQRYLRDE